MSQRRLTPYDNVNTDVTGGQRCGGSSGGPCAEVYLYDAGSGAISCASCNPSGLPPIGLNSEEARGTFLPFDSGSITHAPRIVSADGSRVFFDTTRASSPLTPTANRTSIEWERAGAGSCAHGSALNGGGCLYLISGNGADFSSLVDTDAEGKNVFFVSRSRLIPANPEEKPNLFDARENGGFPGPAASTPCPSAELCHEKGTGPAPGQTHGSETFEANEPEEKTCRKGFVKRHRHCVKQHKKPHKHKKHRAKRSAHNNRRAGK